MRPAIDVSDSVQAPKLINEAQQLGEYLKTLDGEAIGRCMKLSSKKAIQTAELLAGWSSDATRSMPAIDAFIGDIYSGLQVHSLSVEDRIYANKYLLILSGLYGGLRPLDSIMPYRLEMGYRLPDEPYRNLYRFWGDTIASLLPASTSAIVNLSAVEYTKAVLPYVRMPVITPRFMTISPKTGEPTFVVVHAKIARGAFAKWLLVNRIDDVSRLHEFMDLGYRFDAQLSTADQPTFVCEEFGGLGLSVRLT